jgi:hypothetical protein
MFIWHPRFTTRIDGSPGYCLVLPAEGWLVGAVGIEPTNVSLRTSSSIDEFAPL